MAVFFVVYDVLATSGGNRNQQTSDYFSASAKVVEGPFTGNVVKVEAATGKEARQLVKRLYGGTVGGATSVVSGSWLEETV